MKLRRRLLSTALAAAFCTASGFAEKLFYHEAKTDASGRIVPWYGGEPGRAYDHVVRLVWQFWRDMKPCPNGVPYYLQHQVWKPEEDPRGLGGDQIPMALSAWNLLYGYAGDDAVKANMRLMADYWLKHGMSAPDLAWPNLPYPYNTDLHSGRYDGDMRAGKGFLQPDKAGSFAWELLGLHKITGEKKYLAAAVKIADTLAAKVQPGDADSSPWPYRVHTATNAIHEEKDKQGVKFIARYTTNWTGAILLFDELARMGQGNAAAYRRASGMAKAWLKEHPLKTNKWGPFFEDIPTSAPSDTEINADTLAMYILEHPDWDPKWREQAKSILGWSYATFANHEFEKYGVNPINEQTAYKVPGNSHTSRHASVELLYCEKTGDCATKEDAIRRLNWATYTVDDDGKNRYPRDDNWLTDGYGDYVRHYLRAMAAMPELAPADQNHLLRTSSVCRAITYGSAAIRYAMHDRSGTERLRLTTKPARITAGGTELRERKDLSAPGWTWRPMAQGGVVDLRRNSGADVVVTLR